MSFFTSSMSLALDPHLKKNKLKLSLRKGRIWWELQSGMKDLFMGGGVASKGQKNGVEII